MPRSTSRALSIMAVRVERRRASVTEPRLADGRVVTLGAAERHPAALMDMNIANNSLSVLHLTKKHAALAPGVLPMPSDIDQEVATRKLDSIAVAIDWRKSEQSVYLAFWSDSA